MEIWQIAVIAASGALTLMAFVEKLLKLRKSIKEKIPWATNLKSISTLTAQVEELSELLKDNSIITQRLEILLLVYNQPEREDAILGASQIPRLMGAKFSQTP